MFKKLCTWFHELINFILIEDDFSVDENESIGLCGFSDGEAKIESTLN